MTEVRRSEPALAVGLANRSINRRFALWLIGGLKRLGQRLQEQVHADLHLLEARTLHRLVQQQQNAIVNEKVEAAYAGLKPPALARYGETTNREDEVV